MTWPLSLGPRLNRANRRSGMSSRVNPKTMRADFQAVSSIPFRNRWAKRRSAEKTVSRSSKSIFYLQLMEFISTEIELGEMNTARKTIESSGRREGER